MKLVTSALLAVAVAVSACTTLRPTEASPEELQSLIIQEQLIRPGDRVRLIAADDSVHEFRVEKVDVTEGFIVGRNEMVPIANIVAVETRELAVGKTIALAVGLVVGISGLIAVYSAPAAILSAGL